MTLPNNIKKWMNARGITDEVIANNHIEFKNNKIIIPVFNTDGKFLFNKYRRSPFSETGPKYTYDKGATSVFYTPQPFINTAHGFIVEGELDALCLKAKGFDAYSTTGGADTFKPEWVSQIRNEQIYICYDNDSAGMRGTVKLLSIIPRARVVLLPRTGNVKDVTDFFKTHAMAAFSFLVRDAHEWVLPTTISECADAAEYFEGERQRMLSRGEDVDFVDLLLEKVVAIYDSLKIASITRPRSRIYNSPALEAARAVPITEYIKVNSFGYALCVAHSEKTPSMKYYKTNNRVKCYGCGFNGDTIDVVQKLFGLSVGEAIKKINKDI